MFGPGEARVDRGVNVTTRGYCSKLGAVSGAGDRLPAAGAGGGLFGPGEAGVGGGVDRAVLGYCGELSTIGGAGDRSPVFLVAGNARCASLLPSHIARSSVCLV